MGRAGAAWQWGVERFGLVWRGGGGGCGGGFGVQRANAIAQARRARTPQPRGFCPRSAVRAFTGNPERPWAACVFCARE